MTVAELILLLQKLPPETKVVREGDAHAHDEHPLRQVEYRPDPGWGHVCSPSVILR